MNTNRWFHIDFHNMPGINNFCENFDAKKLALTLKKALVTRVNLFAQCNIGYAYYDTEIGIPYPRMKCDMFGESLKACHEENIDVVAYINVGINHELAMNRPEFCRVNEKGQIIEDDKMNNFCRTMCYNNEGYIEYTKQIINELLKYDIDGMFLDCAFVKPCYCSTCKKEMLSRGIDINNESEVYQFAQEKAVKYSKIMKELLPDGLSMYVNCMPYDKMQGIDTHIEVESLPGGWGYDYFPGLVSYARNLYDDVVYMTGRFQKMWADFGGYRSTASLEFDAYDSLVYCCGFSVGDHMHPDGSLDDKLYDDITNIYKKLQKYEKWTNGTKYIKEIAILRNHSTTKQNLLTPSLRGITRMLGELKYNFDVINETMDFSPYSLIIMADEFVVDDETKDKLNEFTKNGGALLSTGYSGVNKEEKVFSLPQYNYLTYERDEEGFEDGWASYYRPIGESRDYSEYCPGILMKNSSGTTLAEHVPAYFPWHYDGLHGYVYIPPKKSVGYCSAAIKDKCAHISFPIFRSYYMYSYPEHRKLVSSIIKMLISDSLIKSDDLPVTSRASVTGCDNYKLLHVKTTYPENKGLAPVVDEHIVLPAGRKVSVRGLYNQVVKLPEEEAIQFKLKDGYTEITLPEICGYDMFLLK